MSGGWAVFISVTLVVFAIGFFILGFLVGGEMARDSLDDRETRKLETERALRDIDRAVFISMLGAAEARAQGTPLPKRQAGLPKHSDRGHL